MLPDFDDKGNIPFGCFSCHIIEFKERFVDFFHDSYSRRSRFKGFLDYSKNICKNINNSKNKFIINGSYISKKLNPNDIDFLVVFNVSTLSEKEYEFSKKEFEIQKALNQQRLFSIELEKRGFMDINDIYCCDWYPLYQREKSDEKYQDYLEDKNYWLNCWGNTRPDNNGIQHPKGLVLLELDTTIFELIQ